MASVQLFQSKNIHAAVLSLAMEVVRCDLNPRDTVMTNAQKLTIARQTRPARPASGTMSVFTDPCHHFLYK